jgi:hypothetical protein
VTPAEDWWEVKSTRLKRMTQMTIMKLLSYSLSLPSEGLCPWNNNDSIFHKETALLSVPPP